MADNTIDTLELQIESNADKAEKALDGLVTSLKKVKNEMGGFKTTEFSQVTEAAFKMAKAFGDAFAPLQKLTKETSKLKTVKVGLDIDDIEKGIDRLRDEFKNVGMDFQFAGNSDELEKAISATTAQLDKLFAKEDKLRNIGANINTGGFRGLEYDISLLTNKLDILRKKREELQKAFAKSFENLPIQRMEYDTTEEKEEKPRVSNISPESFNYNPEAMKAIYGELAGNIKNWNDAVSQFGGNASRVLADMQQNFQNVGGGISGLTEKVSVAGEKIKGSLKNAGLSAEQFETYLENLQIPEIRETNLKKLQSELERTEAKLDELEVKSDNWARKGINPDSTRFRNLQEQIVMLSMKADALRAKIQSVGENEPKLTGWQKLRSIFLSLPKSLDKTKISTKGISRIIDKLKKGFLSLGKSIKGIIPGIGKISKSMSGLKKSSKNGFNLGKMFAMSTLYSTIYAVISGVKNAISEGTQNLAQYSNEYNQSISSMMSALLKLKNAFVVAFAPIVNFVAPTITYFINLLSTAMNKVGRFFSALTGKNFTPQAVSVTQDYAAGLQDTSKGMDNTTDSAKKLKKALSVLSFDQLNQLTARDENGTGTEGASNSGVGELSTSDMFTTVPISKDIKDFADKVKSILSGIFDVFKQAWDSKGTSVIESAKGALRSLSEVAKSVGSTFYEVFTNGVGLDWVESCLELFRSILDTINIIATAFNEAWNSGAGIENVTALFNMFTNINNLLVTIGDSFNRVFSNGVGVEIWTNILGIATGVYNIIGNLASQIQKAWDTAGVGDSIWNGVLTIANTVLETIHGIIDATAEWAEKLDFTPLLNSIDGLLKALQPLTENIGSGLEWFWSNVLLPISSWTLQDAVPTFLNMLSSGIGAVNSVVEALQPLGAWLWDEFLQPLGQWTGEIVISAMETVTGLLDDFGTWVSDHQGIVQNMAIIVGSFFAAFELHSIISGAVSAINGFIGMISGSGGLLGALSSVVSSLGGPVTLAIGAAIAIGVLLYKNWDKIKEAATKLKDWVVDKTVALKDGAIKAFNTLKGNISDAVKAIKTTVSDAWNAIKNKTSIVWNGLKNIIKSPINAIIGFINGLLQGVQKMQNGIADAMNNLNIDLPGWLQDLTGYSSIGFNIGYWTAPTIPYLAKGGLAMGITPAVIGEAGREAVLPLENKRTMSMIADSILSNASGMGVDEEVLTNAFERALVRFAMNNQQSQKMPEYIQNSIYLDSEVMARAVTKAQQKIDYRMNPTPKFSY